MSREDRHDVHLTIVSVMPQENRIPVNPYMW